MTDQDYGLNCNEVEGINSDEVKKLALSTKKYGTPQVPDLRYLASIIPESYLPRTSEYELVGCVPPDCARLDDRGYEHIYVSRDGRIYVHAGSVSPKQGERYDVVFRLIPIKPKHGPASVHVPRTNRGGRYWEVARLVLKAHGIKVHHNKIITYLDGDTTNFDLDNLAVRSVREPFKPTKEEGKDGRKKLHESEVIEMRREHHVNKVPVSEIAKRFPDLAYPSIWAAVMGRTWKQLPLVPSND